MTYTFSESVTFSISCSTHHVTNKLTFDNFEGILNCTDTPIDFTHELLKTNQIKNKIVER